MAQGFETKQGRILGMQEAPSYLEHHAIRVMEPYFSVEKLEASNTQEPTKSAYYKKMITSGETVAEDNLTMETSIPFCPKLCGRAIEKTCRSRNASVVCPTQIQAPRWVTGYEDRPTMCSSDSTARATSYIHDNRPPLSLEASSNCCDWVTPSSPKCWNESDKRIMLNEQMLGEPSEDFEHEFSGLNDHTPFPQECLEDIVTGCSDSDPLKKRSFNTEMTLLKSTDNLDKNPNPLDTALTIPADTYQETVNMVQLRQDDSDGLFDCLEELCNINAEPIDEKSITGNGIALCENLNPVDSSLNTPNDAAQEFGSQVLPGTKQEHGNLDNPDKIPPRRVVPQIWNGPKYRLPTLTEHIRQGVSRDLDSEGSPLTKQEYGKSTVFYLDHPKNRSPRCVVTQIYNRSEPRWLTLPNRITSEACTAFFQSFEEIPNTIEADASNRDFIGFWRKFDISAPSEMGSIWRDMTHKIKHYAMFKGRSKRKKTSIGITNDVKRREEKNVGVIYEMFSILKEGPAEIMLMQPPENNRRNGSPGNKYKRQPSDVEADGIISDLASDPPGQQSVYIPPGDNRRELYRLSTFEQFPSRVVISATLAKHGFVYTGFYDRVKCFSCGRTVEKWESTDNPADRKWHKPECLFVRGIPTGNIPIGSFFSQSFSNNFLSTNTQQPMEVAPSYTSQIMNGPVMRIPTDVPGTASTFQIQPGSSVVIGSSQNPPPSRPPVASRPANPPASAPRRGWRMANVISADHKRHLTNLYLNRELDRLASFGRWPTERRNVSPVALARAGFFYLGDMDRTQCFSCGGVLRNWSYEDDAMEEHRTHFANCRFVVGTERRNVPIPDRPETPQEQADKFPCRFPMNPHMRSEASRLDTFDRRWPTSRIRAKPNEIAEAGFFFLGERDRVKCWYCNGGLQNWEYDDIPWVEHAKWFPNCQFLLQKQGQLFVYRYLSLNPHLPRPIIGRQDGSTIDPVVTPPVGQSARVQDIPPSEPRARAPSPPPSIIDPQEEIRKRQERVDREMQNSETVKFVLLMGYAADTVRRVLREKLESGTPFDAENIFEGTAALLDAVMKMEEEIEKEKQQEQATNIKFPAVSQSHGASAMESMETAPSMGHTSGVFEVSGFSHDSDDEERDLYGSISENPTNTLFAGAVGVTTNGPVSGGFVGALANGPMSLGTETRSSLLGVPEDPESLKEFIEQKKEERLCKICFTENADMVFIPCSHMVCCKTCTEAIRQCPVCRTKIEKAIKTYVK